MWLNSTGYADKKGIEIIMQKCVTNHECLKEIKYISYLLSPISYQEKLHCLWQKDNTKQECNLNKNKVKNK